MTTSSAIDDLPQLYRAHGAEVGRFIKRLTGPGPHVEELLQDTFVVAFKSRTSFLERSSLKTWLYGIARNLCRRHHRTTRRWRAFKARLFAQERSTTVAMELDLEERQRTARLVPHVHAALAELPAGQREVLVLQEFEGLAAGEIATILGIAPNAVSNRLFHARKRFSQVLQAKLTKEAP